MMLIQELLLVCDAFGEAKGVGRKRVATLVLNRGGRLDDLADGSSDIGTKIFERAMQWLSDNWPADAEWPEGVARPAPAAIPTPEAAE